MENGCGAMSQRAIKAGISDGFVRAFSSELHKFKCCYAIALHQMIHGS
jgi:hypothetical protein